MLTALNPPEHGVRENGLFQLQTSIQSLPELLPTEIRAAAFVGAFPLEERFGLGQGFDHYDDAFSEAPNRMSFPERKAEEVLASTESWLRGIVAPRPFLLIHLYDPHQSYDPPPPWKRLADQGNSTQEYESEVAYTDREVGRFLRRVGAWSGDRTWTILLVSDHGESLGAHREPTHGIFIYDVTQRVPMILVGPAVPPQIEQRLRTLLDVAPTLLQVYGVDPPAEWKGATLLEAPRSSSIYIETKHTELLRGWSALHGMRTAEWKYIRAPRPELYDLTRDPGESRNLIDSEPAVARRLSGEVDRILEAAPAALPPHSDSEVLEQLHALGYVAHVEPGSVKTSAKDPKDGIESVAALFEGQEAFLDSNFARAEVFLQRALRLDPQSKEAHSFLSGTYFALRRFALSADYARRALDLPPHLNEAPLHATIGEALLELGKSKEAAESLRESLRLKPDDPKVRALLERAESGHS
jgi:hypothetical protein